MNLLSGKNFTATVLWDVANRYFIAAFFMLIDSLMIITATLPLHYSAVMNLQPSKYGDHSPKKPAKAFYFSR
jgi:hypothetical protein